MDANVVASIITNLIFFSVQFLCIPKHRKQSGKDAVLFGGRALFVEYG